VSSPQGLSQDAIRRLVDQEELVGHLEAPVRKVLAEELASIVRSLSSAPSMSHDELRMIHARTWAALEFAKMVDRARKELALGGGA